MNSENSYHLTGMFAFKFVVEKAIAMTYKTITLPYKVNKINANI
jgi:hypothetical protein